MSDVSKSEESAEPVIETPPGESMHSRLKRIGQMPCKEGGPRFVLGSNLGPITFTPLPTPPNEDDAEADVEHLSEDEE